MLIFGNPVDRREKRQAERGLEPLDEVGHFSKWACPQEQREHLQARHPWRGCGGIRLAGQTGEGRADPPFEAALGEVGGGHGVVAVKYGHY